MASEEYIDVLSDGGVRKKVLTEGTGDIPPLHAQCLVHYKGTLAQSQEVFMDTRNESQGGEPAHIVAGRDSSLRETGLNLAVSTMRKGERCHLKVSSEYGYGDRGSFSFPAVPPRTELEYELELIDFDPADELKDRSKMTYEERLEAAERHRIKGNALFQEGQHTDALGRYAMALSYINDDFMVQLHGPHADKAGAVKQAIHLNMAACQLKLQDWQGAAWNCSQVLQEDKGFVKALSRRGKARNGMGHTDGALQALSDGLQKEHNLRPASIHAQVLQEDRGNVKALFRRGKAHNGMGHTDEALQDLQAAAKLVPADKAVSREIQAVKAAMKRDREAQAELFKGAFGAPGESRSKGLWEDTAEQQQQQRGSFFAWLWGVLLACFGVFTLGRNTKVK